MSTHFPSATQIVDLILVVGLILIVQQMFKIRIRSTMAALALSAVIISEVIVAELFNLLDLKTIFAFYIIVLFDPVVEEAFRVRFFLLNKVRDGKNLLESSAMIGSVEAVIKVLTYTTTNFVEDYFSALNYYILLSGVLSVLLHINLGLILTRLGGSNNIRTFTVMALIHSFYNLVCFLIEPPNAQGRIIYLSILFALNFLYLASQIRPYRRAALSDQVAT